MNIDDDGHTVRVGAAGRFDNHQRRRTAERSRKVCLYCVRTELNTNGNQMSQEHRVAVLFNNLTAWQNITTKLYISGTRTWYISWDHLKKSKKSYRLSHREGVLLHVTNNKTKRQLSCNPIIYRGEFEKERRTNQWSQDIVCGLEYG